MSLDVYGVTVSVDSAEPEVLDWVGPTSTTSSRTPMARCPMPDSAPSPVARVRIPAGAVPRAASAFSVVHRRGSEVFADFDGRGLWSYDARAGQGTAESEDPSMLREIVRNAIAFKVDEHLARRGLHVFRWLGLSHAGRATLLLAPSRTGKTTLALDLLAEHEVDFLGDDRVVVGRGGEVLPYPVSLHPREDALAGSSVHTAPGYTSLTGEARAAVDMSVFPDRTARRCRPHVIALCRRVAAERPVVEPVSRAGFARRVARDALATRVAGPRAPGALAPRMFPLDDRPPRARWSTAADRSAAAVGVLRRSRAHLVGLGSERSANARAVAELVASAA